MASVILILDLIPHALRVIPLYRVRAELGATDHLAARFLSAGWWRGLVADSVRG